MCKIKAFSLYIAGIVLIITLFILPRIFFSLSDIKLFSSNHDVVNIKFELDSDVQDIVMVERIHLSLDSYYLEENKHDYIDIGYDTVELYNASSDIGYGYKALEDIKSISVLYNLINENFDLKIEENSEDTESGLFESTEFTYLQYINKYTSISMIYDCLTEKIVKLDIDGENTVADTDENKHALCQEWIKYLNLDIIDDWYYSSGRYISDKAHLALNCIIDNGLQLYFELL